MINRRRSRGRPFSTHPGVVLILTVKLRNVCFNSISQNENGKKICILTANVWTLLEVPYIQHNAYLLVLHILIYVQFKYANFDEYSCWLNKFYINFWFESKRVWNFEDIKLCQASKIWEEYFIRVALLAFQRVVSNLYSNICLNTNLTRIYGIYGIGR